MSDFIINKIAKLAINAASRRLVAKIVELAQAETARNIMITLEDLGELDAAEVVGANWPTR